MDWVQQSCLDVLDYSCSLNLVIIWSLFSLLHLVCKEKKEKNFFGTIYIFQVKNILNNSKGMKTKYNTKNIC